MDIWCEFLELRIFWIQ